jgi:protein-tyrosine phosphatase
MKYTFVIAAAFFLLPIFSSAQLQVTQLSTKVFLVDAQDDYVNALKWSSKPDSWKGSKSVSLTSSSDTVIVNDAHPIFRLENDKKTIYSSSRAVMLEAADNFRDLGGYTATDGRQVKWGKIYRSAELSDLTLSDKKVIEELDIKVVCDLRGTAEVKDSPDQLPAGITYLNLPAGSEKIGTMKDYAKSVNLNSKVNRDSMTHSSYQKIAHYKAKYKPLFDNLLALENNNALVFHCTAGKDRTGVAAALILSSLGVSKDQIMKDYVATNIYWKRSKEKIKTLFMAEGVTKEQLETMFIAKEYHLEGMFVAINNQYGSMDNFLEKELELTPEKRNRLREKFLY